MHLKTQIYQKRINPKLTPEQWERIAIRVFQGVYSGQLNRVLKTLRRIDRALFDQIEREFWNAEPAIVKISVQKFYDEIGFSNAISAIDDFDLNADWNEINESIFALSQTRAGFFARAMTLTSQRQTQIVIRDWLDTEGSTVQQLRDRLTPIWEGPRPDVAARTETTYMVAHSQVAAWKAAGVWGYNVETKNDDRVRDTHMEVSRNSPYPLSDTTHLPPIFDDFNCRCFVSPEENAPQ